ncbi:lysosomal Pro-X carboxypeptidase-like isoform X2 [Glycine soja]|uniref:lysosomal Pro-X carboxypeptidase isoform X2 n=1 Tax=Glycine max TaxID=3847 RepID=UPI000296B5D4|nr:lysosomal Pro-X carboxypeptidase isoform X2 [Glycine max]XP_028232117.1 lysosomal Pro-X carboxypeptidase-like isoform X2 [Glycine soja]|eukprot:XP_006573176.1 lysosomal Pro-X carboxypeptidase isoform X2 [Glycine max]
MKHHSLSFKWLLLIFLTHSTLLTATHSLTIPRMSPIPEWETTLHNHPAINTEEVKTFYFKQVLDHFNYRPESYTTFQQRYLINFKYWGGANSSAPIFAYFGAESPIDNSPNGVGFLTDNAASFNALLVYIECLLHGLGSNIPTWRLVPWPHQLQSYTLIKLHHKMVTTLLSQGIIDGLQEASETCYETVLKSWSEIRRIASQPNGLVTLSQRFNTCHTLNQSYELIDYLRSTYVYAAQYNQPPRYPVSMICGGIDGESLGSDILSKIYAGIVALRGNSTCKVNGPTNVSETTVGWRWQTCSEMVIPIGIGNDTMFEPIPFNLTRYAEGCKEQYGVSPRPHWVTTYYGGHNIKLVLRRLGSNIIFSNGLRDPYSIGGVLDNISDSIVAVHTVNGSHCLDLLRANQSDPGWLVEQRKKEVKIIKRWITQYYADLDALKDKPKFQSK